MKKEGENINLEELFRSKFENAEVIPSLEADKIIMKKLARKEFIRFNYARFNIYYLGALIIGGISAALLFSGVKEIAPTVVINNPVISGIIAPENNSNSEPAVSQKTIVIENIDINIGTRSAKTITTEKSVKKDTGPVEEASDNTLIHQAQVNDNLSKTGVIEKGNRESGRLKGVLRTYSARMETSVTSGCAPLSVRFYNKSEGADSCMWYLGNSYSSKEMNPTIVFEKEGDYSVSLKVWFPDGSVKYSDRTIIVHPRPVAAFEVNKELSLLREGETVFSNFSINAVSYKWDFGDGTYSEFFEPSHSFSASVKNYITLTAVSGFGCIDSVMKITDHSSGDNYINFPNAFIPNSQGPTGGLYSSKSDEAAQIFHPVTSGVSEYRLRIFSKRGIVVFETRDLAVGWDGYVKGTLCEPGVYVWEASGTFKNGRSFIKMGDVTLLKE